MASSCPLTDDNQTENDETNEEDELDPRVQGELDLLNEASGTINRLELELDEARCSFRQLLTESTQQLNALAKRLGSCIEKARPYYEARMKTKEAQVETQKATRRYERACSQLVAAKEMVSIAEVGFFNRNKGQNFDPAWQEMLNHATLKVNNAERERLESDLEHKRMAAIFNEREQKVKRLQKDLKRNIAKSRPYFEVKAKFNQTMEDKKCCVDRLDKQLTESKKTYAGSLQNLEAISEQIHQQRQEAVLRKQLGSRGTGVGAEQPAPPPATERCSKEPFGIYAVTPAMVVEDVTASPRKVRGKNWLSASSFEGGGSFLNSREGSVVGSPRRTRPTSIEMIKPKKPMHSSDLDVDSDGTLLSSGNASEAASLDMLTPVSDFSHPGTQGSTAGSMGGSAATSSIASPEEITLSPSATGSEPKVIIVDPERTRRTNAEVMRSVQHANSRKMNPYPAGHLLSVSGRSRDGFLDELSDTESLTGSIASVSMLDDDQVQSLMIETEDMAAQVLCSNENITAADVDGANFSRVATTLTHQIGVPTQHSELIVTPEQALIVETSCRLQELVEKCLLVDQDDVSKVSKKETLGEIRNNNDSVNIQIDQLKNCDSTIVRGGAKSELSNNNLINAVKESNASDDLKSNTTSESTAVKCAVKRGATDIEENVTVETNYQNGQKTVDTGNILHPLQSSGLPDICPK